MTRPQRSDAHVVLGAELRRIRKSAGLTLRQIKGASTSAAHLSLAERGLAGVTEKVIEAYIAIGGDRSKLYDLYYKTQEDARATFISEARSQGPPTLDSPFKDIAASYALVSAEDIYQIGSDGSVDSVTNILDVRPRLDGIELAVSSFSYPNDRRSGVLGLKSGVGCGIGKIEEGETGIIDFVLRFDRPLKMSDADAYRFSFSVEVNSNQSCAPMIRASARHLRRHVLMIQFTPPALPEKVWWFRGGHMLDGEVKPSPGNVMKITDNNFYLYEFLELRNEYWGISWLWNLAD